MIRECYGALMTLTNRTVSSFMPVLQDTASVRTSPILAVVLVTMTATTFMTIMMRIGSASVIEQVK